MTLTCTKKMFSDSKTMIFMGTLRPSEIGTLRFSAGNALYNSLELF